MFIKNICKDDLRYRLPPVITNSSLMSRDMYATNKYANRLIEEVLKRRLPQEKKVVIEMVTEILKREAHLLIGIKQNEIPQPH